MSEPTSPHATSAPRFATFKDDFSLPKAEEKVIAFWREHHIFQQVTRAAEGRPPYVFFEGPPTANGRPGIHHVISRTVKDLICRYKAMQGYRVDRKGGWDTHGLPVEIEVEKQLKLDSKQKIVEYGIAAFNQKCRESVFKYLDDWNRITERTGYWLDLDKAYVTLNNEYIESVWSILANFHERGLIYKGHKTVPYCPRCGTGLSSHEVALGYETVKDPSVFIKFKSKSGDYNYLVWTTTPWTLPSNAALAFKSDAEYSLIEFENEKYVMASALIAKVFGADAAIRVIETKRGSDFVGQHYEPLFPFYANEENAFRVFAGDFVTLEDGTGIVHIAPGYGADDYELGKANNLPVLQAVEANGHFKAGMGAYAGMFFKEADTPIIIDLKKSGRMFKKDIYEHTYPFCWRCHSPLIYIARESWYIRTTQFRDQLLANSNAINWVPDDVRTGRMQNWLENNVDWAISRERFWGTPLPLWVCDTCEKQKAIGSVEMLKALGSHVPDDLHKPYIDDVTLKCVDPTCSGRMKRVPEVIDVWFDSGAMPYAQWGTVFYGQNEIESFAADAHRFPAEFISEAIDQTRGWFYSLLAISTMLTGKVPFRNVIVLEFILDKEGKKMSKHKGNVVDPFATIEKHGADPVRWYLIAASSPSTPTKFDESALGEVVRKHFDTLRNTYSFFALYANTDDVASRAKTDKMSIAEWLEKMAGPRTIFDRWIESKLNSLVAEVTRQLDAYDITRPVRAIQNFVIEELSNWYVRLNRRRFWGSGDDPDKFRAYATLHNALETVCRLSAPVAPITSELFWRELQGYVNSSDATIHAAQFPKSDAAKIEKELESVMSQIQTAVSLGRAARNKSIVKTRQPLQSCILHSTRLSQELDKLELRVPQTKLQFIQIVADELNIRQLEFVPYERIEAMTWYKPVIDYKVAGQKLGSKMKEVASLVANLDQTDLKRLKSQSKFELQTSTGPAILENNKDIIFFPMIDPPMFLESEGEMLVVIDSSITPELRAEGFARETINKIQTMRKAAGFEVVDQIEIKLDVGETLRHALTAHEGFIKKETLATAMTFASLPKPEKTETGNPAAWDVNGESAVIQVTRVNS